MSDPSDPTAARVKQVMALAFNTPVDQVSDDAAIMDTPGWDSLGHANLMLALEEAFDLTLPEDAYVDLQSLPEIVTYLHAHTPG